MKLYGNYFGSYEETYDEEVLNKKEGCDSKQFKITGMDDNKLPKWLESKNDFNEAKKLINDVRIDKSNVKVGYKDKSVFNYLNRLITEISNNKAEKENATERLNKSISDFNQPKQKKQLFFKTR